jgi:hypothetical protein
MLMAGRVFVSVMKTLCSASSMETMAFLEAGEKETTFGGGTVLS